MFCDNYVFCLILMILWVMSPQGEDGEAGHTGEVGKQGPKVRGFIAAWSREANKLEPYVSQLIVHSDIYYSILHLHQKDKAFKQSDEDRWPVLLLLLVQYN